MNSNSSDRTQLELRSALLNLKNPRGQVTTQQCRVTTRYIYTRMVHQTMKLEDNWLRQGECAPNATGSKERVSQALAESVQEADAYHV